MSLYFLGLKREAERAAAIARTARSRGLDPVRDVEIPFADDLAGRVENLVGPPGIAVRIRELAPRMSREALTLNIAQSVARDLRGDRERALDQATRTGLAILTEGVLVAPLEGIASVTIGRNHDGTEYADISFAGPIRAAGGTAQAMSVLIADVVRQSLGLGVYKATEQEVLRYIEEFQLYKNLQYKPENAEIEKVVRSCPVCINGEGTEKYEVQGNRDLPRVPTNQVRSGICLVIAEGLLLKAKKMIKIIKTEEIKGWEFLEELGLKKKEEPKDDHAEGSLDEIPLDGLEEDEEGIAEALQDEGDLMNFIGEDGRTESVALNDAGISPKVQAAMKYIADLIAGRPVFSHPSRPGGFRLRYGRGRTCGLASIGMSPLTLEVTGQFLAVGTQVKIERPGKAGAVTAVDSIDGPIVLLTNGDLVKVEDRGVLASVMGRISKITDLGEILIPFGEFAENNHPLVQGSYTTDWWEQELRCALYKEHNGIGGYPYEGSLHLDDEADRIRKECFDEVKDKKEAEELGDKRVKGYMKEEARKADSIEREMSQIDISGLVPSDAEAAFSLSERYSVPLHPRYTLFWHDISLKDLGLLRTHLTDRSRTSGDGAVLSPDPAVKEVLIKLGCPHRETPEGYHLGAMTLPLLRPAGIGADLRARPFPPNFKDVRNIMEAVCLLSGVTVRERSPTRIGARMGRPEKADLRKMKPPVHALYPVGIQGGPQRLVNKTFDAPVDTNAVPRLCPSCRNMFPYTTCPECMRETVAQSDRSREGLTINTRSEAERAVKVLGLRSVDEIPSTKGVKGLISKEKVPERLEKGILRAKHGVFVFRDGTARYDMTDITITHFRPREVGSPVERLKALGYLKDAKGADLVDPDQVLELLPQDIIVNEECGDYLLKVASFVDEELERFYGCAPYYKAKVKEDLIGTLAIGLAPHTSGGVLCRVAGFSKAQGCLGHPYYHAAKRRNCDGDEDAIMLLMDGLLNFSRKFLPEKRGGQMDAPLVLSMRLDPMEVDKEAHNVDLRSAYPLDFYMATLKGAKVNDYWMHRMDTIKRRLKTPAQYEGFGYSAETANINDSPTVSAYKTINVTIDKIDRQLELARMIRAVDADDVAERILSTHLLPDMIGNLRSFSTQQFRCGKCGAKYRRIPLAGRCTNWIKGTNAHRCDNKLILTVSEGSVKKYLAIASDISKRYAVSNYLKQRIDLMGKNIESIFPEQYKETTLDKFM